MDTLPSSSADVGSALCLALPDRQLVPMVFASPHSGREYPASFVNSARLDARALRRSEDSFVEELWADVTEIGAPLISARFPRAYCDPNREPYELDPAMFSGPLPQYANTRSPRVVAGLGTIARVVASGAEIYARKLPVSEVETRIGLCYRPYHAALGRLVDETRANFGWSLLVDCHSMPSVGGPMDHDSGLSRVDVVLGDCFGAACDPIFTEAAETSFTALGYRVVHNTPYAGGFTTRHYGKPGQGSHALQIEINRALYMNEADHSHASGFESLRRDLRAVARALAEAAKDFAQS